MTESTTTGSWLSFTESALRQLRRVQAAEAQDGRKCLRVFVESGGCAGRQYGMLFDDAKQEDLTLSFDGTRVVIDKASAEMLRGSVVDYVDALNDSGFRITNPNARQSCGCGKSFEA